MRRPWLLALLAAALVAPTAACDPTPDEVPTDAEAPTPAVGQITFPTIANSPTDGFINVAECQGGTIRFKAQFDAGSNPTAYQLYAANDDAIFDETTGECDDTPTTEITGFVGATVDGERTDEIAGDFVADATYSTSAIAAAAGEAACDSAQKIHLCLQGRRGTANVAVARTTLDLVVGTPRTPFLSSVRPGERGLNVEWDATSPGLNESYAVVTRTTHPLDPDVVGTQEVVRTSPRVSGTSLRVGGLANGALYTVEVLAFNDADNPSDPSNSTTASPVEVSDFWEMYQDQPSPREQGGCGTGGVGVGSLLALAVVIALRRRS